jgi:hypothetical protein
LLQIIQRTFYILQMSAADFGIDFGGSDVFVSQQFLNKIHIRATFQQMRGVAVPQMKKNLPTSSNSPKSSEQIIFLPSPIPVGKEVPMRI